MLFAGVVTPSFGLNCAHMAGVNDSVIEQAQQVIIASLQPAIQNHMEVIVILVASHAQFFCMIVQNFQHSASQCTRLCNTRSF